LPASPGGIKLPFLERCRELVRPYYLRAVYFPFFQGRPPEFSAAWRYPTSPLRAATVSGKAPAFLFLPMSDWHSRKQRSHHFASMLAARGHDCYFLNPHLGRHYAAPYPFHSEPLAGALGPHLTELHVRLPREPVYHHRLLTHGEARRLAQALQPLAETHSRGMAQIVSFPTWGETALLLRERYGWPIIYDCHDLLQGFRNVAKEIVAAESEPLKAADFVVFSSEFLRRAHASSRLPAEKVALLRNAVDARFLASPQAAAPGLQKTAGYVGALEDWFDVEALSAAARANPDALFRIIGRVENAGVRALQSLPNVNFEGEVPHERLPEVLAGFTVGLIPFLVNELTRAADPIKLYEYFSAGLPVVSSRLPEVERYAGLLYLSDSPPDFAARVTQALAENDSSLRARRRAAVESETWNARAEELLRIAANLTRY
jgi:glycosyltransferase involved in cell wall biosynthesis